MTSVELGDDDLGKPIYTAEGDRLGTLRGVDRPTIYVELAGDLDEKLRSDIKVSETTSKSADGSVLAGAPLGAVERVTDEAIHFWHSYAALSRHESVRYEEIPAEEGGDDLHEERES